MAGVAQGGGSVSVHGRPWWLVPADIVTAGQDQGSAAMQAGQNQGSAKGGRRKLM